MSKDLAMLNTVMKTEHPHSYKYYCFNCVSVSARLFIFEHENHTACSSMTLKDFDTAIPRDSKMARLGVPHSCNFCYTFLPFLCDNDNLLYEEEFKDHQTFSDHSKLKPCPTESPFFVLWHCHLFSENVWTRRLANSLNTFYFTKDSITLLRERYPSVLTSINIVG